MVFPIRIPIEVRFADLDALAHVNNAIYLSYDEIGRTHYIRAIGAVIGGGNLIMARAEVDFIKPIVMHQQVELQHRVVQVGNKSFRTFSQLWADGVLAARTSVVVVWLENGIPARVPDPIRQRIRALETEAVEGL